MNGEIKTCPVSGCNNQGWYPNQISEDEWEQVQCEFCYTEPNSVFNIISRLEATIEQDKILIQLGKEAVDFLATMYEGDEKNMTETVTNFRNCYKEL